ncbi:hypothetical protein ACPW96_22500 [Micromonospora sp. DT81.3]|uniref:hypothetical protein n=1 Tax=Micromonospora sp. DT81.3 TaxID=3416523 RepID=UPI003CF5DCFF
MLADGILPDPAWAIDSPVRFALPQVEARALLARVSTVPTPTWGRDAFRCGDMWNSNSLVSWLLQTSGIDAMRIRPPGDGRAPGWASGIALRFGAVQAGR